MKIQKNISNSNSFLDNFSKKSNSSFINNSNNLNLSINKNNQIIIILEKILKINLKKQCII